MTVESSPFVYFTRLSIENVRAFGPRQELKLTDEAGNPARWTLIIGENGVGKTTLLHGLAWMRPLFNVDPQRRRGPRTYVEPALSRDENVDIDALARKGRDIKARMGAALTMGTRLGEGARPQRTVKTSITIIREGGTTVDIRASEDKLGSFRDPLVLGYGAGRHLGFSNLDSGAIDPIASLFDASVELYDVKEILFRLDYHRMRRRPLAGARLKALKVALASILPDIRSAADLDIDGPRAVAIRPGGIHVRTPYGRVPFDELSLGYRTITAWTVDIAWRLFAHYPNSANPLEEPAIVLVDEIDLHLHPRWQRRIRHDLTRYFPNIQFIVTAHSPLMAQSYLGENLAVVRRVGNHAVINNDPLVVRGWRLDQVITSELFDFQSARPPDIEEKIVRRATLIRKSRRTPAEQVELRKLDEFVAELPTTEDPDDQEAMDMVRRAASLLSDRRGRR